MEYLLRLVKQTVLLVVKTNATLSSQKKINPLDHPMNISTQGKSKLKKESFWQGFPWANDSDSEKTPTIKRAVAVTVLKKAHGVTEPCRRRHAKPKQTSRTAYFNIQAKVSE